MRAEQDMPVHRTQPGDDIPSVVAEFLHPDIKSGLPKLIKDVLRRFRGPRLCRAPSCEPWARKKRHMTSEPVDRNGSGGQKGNEETRRQNT